MCTNLPIIIPKVLTTQFHNAWQYCRVLLFCAPCGCGKTTMVRQLLSTSTVCERNAEDNGFLDKPFPLNKQVILIDNLQYLKDSNQQQKLCALITNSPNSHFVLLSRGGIPGWLMAFQFAGMMKTFDMESMRFDRTALIQLMEAYGIAKMEENAITTILEESRGHAAALTLFCKRLAVGETLDDAMLGNVCHDIYRYFHQSVYCRLEVSLRKFILKLAPFEDFDIQLACMVSGEDCAGELVERIRQDTSIIIVESTDRFSFQSFFKQFLQWEMTREFTQQERKTVFSRAGLYYEHKNSLSRALDCYEQAGDFNKVSELLIINAQLHPGMAQYYELKKYYFALPREEIIFLPYITPPLLGILLIFFMKNDFYMIVRYFLREISHRRQKQCLRDLKA